MAELVPVDHDPFAAPSALEGQSPANDPRDFTDRYNTTLSSEQEQQYQQWLQQQPPNARNTYDYDMRGAFIGGAGADPSQRDHYPDTYKKPNHPTFSTGSQYHGVDDYTGGVWGEPTPDGGTTFTPGPTNLQMYGAQGLQDYFQRVEPTNKLIVPPDAAPLDQAVPAPQSALSDARQPEAPGVPSVARPLLDAVSSGEAPGYNIRYDGGKGTTFDSFDDHPRKMERITVGPYQGKYSDAAGRYQFISTTYDKLAKQYGLPDFSPESQDFAAWQLANNSYRNMTRGKGDLTEALQAGRYDDIAKALSPEWASIARNPRGFVSTLRKLSAGGLAEKSTSGVNYSPVEYDPFRQSALGQEM